MIIGEAEPKADNEPATLKDKVISLLFFLGLTLIIMCITISVSNAVIEEVNSCGNCTALYSDGFDTPPFIPIITTVIAAVLILSIVFWIRSGHNSHKI